MRTVPSRRSGGRDPGRRAGAPERGRRRPGRPGRPGGPAGRRPSRPGGRGRGGCHPVGVARPTVSPARAAAHAVVLRTLQDGAWADRALRAEAARARRRASGRWPSAGLRHGPAAPDARLGRRRRHEPGATLDPRVRAALQLGLSSSCSSTASPTTPRSREAVELAKPSPGPPARQRGAAPRCARRASSCPPTTTPPGAAMRHRHPEWLVAAVVGRARAPRDAGAAGGRQRARRARAARQHARRPTSRPSGLAGRREGDAFVLDGPADARGHPGWAPGRASPSQSRGAQRVAATRRPAARRARARPLRRAGRQDDAPGRADGRRGRGRRRRAPRAAGRARCGRPARACGADERRGRRAPTPRAFADARRLRPRPARPARAAAWAPCGRTPTCAGAHSGGRHRAAGRAAGRTCSTAARGRAAGRRRASWCTPSARSRPRRSGCAAPTTGAPCPHRDGNRRLLHCRAMEELERRPASARPATSRGCARRTCAGRYRCVNCLHRFELRSVCPDCGEHSTIVRMSSTATTDCNHCGGSMLARGLTRRIAPSILAADFGRLREQVSEVVAAGATRHPRRRHGRPLRPAARPWARAPSSALREPAACQLDVHLMVERPERHVDDFAEAGADNDHRPRRGDAARRTTRVQAIREAGLPAPALALNPGTPPDGARRGAPATSSWRCA